MHTFTGKQYLLIDIANQYGLDRLTWQERIDWTTSHLTQLESLKEQADKPILFAKAVRALRHTENQEPTSFIMGLDATASGLQILAVMSGCHDTAACVNLVNTGHREDVYQEVASEMSEQLQTVIDRDMVKKPIMTKYYGSTAVPENKFGKDSKELEAFMQALDSRMPGAEQLMKLFQSHWNPEAEYYTWRMPDNHVVHIPVVDTVQKKIEVDEFHHMTFQYRTSVIHPQKEGRALAANIVHSIDGYVAREMIRRAESQGFGLATIHDCFYAHPNYMNAVRRNYLKILAELADKNLVEDILSQITGYPVSYEKIDDNLAMTILSADYALS
jgi:DNA-directed RNA polymerase